MASLTMRKFTMSVPKKLVTKNLLEKRFLNGPIQQILMVVVVVRVTNFKYDLRMTMMMMLMTMIMMLMTVIMMMVVMLMMNYSTAVMKCSLADVSTDSQQRLPVNHNLN